MRVANFNIRSNPPMRKKRVRADLRAAKRTGAKIFFWQELAVLPWYRTLLREEFPHALGWTHHHLRHRSAITVDEDFFDVLRVRRHKLIGGMLRLPQPARHMNEIVVQPKIFDRHLIALLSGHFDNGGYNGKWRPRWNRKLRQKRWDAEFEGACQLVHSLHEEGLTVIGGMDPNRKDMPKFHPEQQWLLQAPHDVVKLWIVPASGTRYVVSAQEVIGERWLNTDHVGLAASVTLLAGNVVT